MRKLALNLLLASALALTTLGAPAEIRIRCASTTSTQNSGLFDYLLPIFEKKTGIKVDVIAVGTGAAIELGKRGDADVVLVHAKEQELAAVEQGYFIDRHDLMYNDFLLVGPPADPARLKFTLKVADAFKRIAETDSPFVSRGDKSGTHTKELAIWKLTGVEPKGQPWYLDVGQGMEKTQRIASEKRAYTLTDRGTWLATKDKDKLELVSVFEGDPVLFNQYGVMLVNPAKHPHVEKAAARQFLDWLISAEGQATIGAYQDKAGNVLFHPNAGR